MPPSMPIARLSVIIPAYNAAAVLAATIADVHGWLESAGIRHEIIVVDDGSTDDTSRVARELSRPVSLVPLRPNRGKGAAVRAGVVAAFGPFGLTRQAEGLRHEEAWPQLPPESPAWVLFMDADNSTRISHLERFLPLLTQPDPPQVLIASRRLAASRIVRRQHRLRQALGRTFPYLVRLIALPGISDTQCGFKLFSAAAARDIFSRLRTQRFAFDVEVLLLARRLGYPIAEVPVDWDNPTDSTVRIHTDTFRMVWDLLKMTARIRLRRR